MLVPLSVTLHPLRAHIEAGVLEEHGIPAWVWGDVTSCSYGTVTTGGCRVMVDEENVAAANEVLKAVPPPVDENAGETGPRPEPVTVWRALGTGVVHGAVLLPLTLMMLLLVLALLWEIPVLISGAGKAGEFLPALGRALASIPVPGMLYGIVLGLGGGLAAWLIGDYKRHGRAGRLFVGLMIALMAVVALLL
jgi:hypothetical protein